MKIIKICKECGKEFESEDDDSNHFLCSLKCWSVYPIDKTEVWIEDEGKL